MSVQYQIVNYSDKESLVLIVDGEPETVASNHSNYTRIKEYVLEGGEDVNILRTLIDAKQFIPNVLTKLSERVGYKDGDLTFDGEVIDTALSRHIVRLVKEGDDGWVPFVKFMENLAQNPSKLSRLHLFKWLQAEDFTITEDGLIVGYKAVQDTDDNLSIRSGDNVVYVNGEEHTGHVPNPEGAVVEIARNEVDTDRNVGCSYGLHVGIYDYATKFGGWHGLGYKVLQVHVNPRDVVSVPSDEQDQKMRVCRYTVVGPVEEVQKTALWVPTYEEQESDDLFDEEQCDECGEYIDDCEYDGDHTDEYDGFDDDDDPSYTAVLPNDDKTENWHYAMPKPKKKWYEILSDAFKS